MRPSTLSAGTQPAGHAPPVKYAIVPQGTPSSPGSPGSPEAPRDVAASSAIVAIPASPARTAQGRHELEEDMRARSQARAAEVNVLALRARFTQRVERLRTA
jgi:hypothetical protein